MRPRSSRLRLVSLLPTASLRSDRLCHIIRPGLSLLQFILGGWTMEDEACTTYRCGRPDPQDLVLF